MTHEESHELYELYALGLLEPEEAAGIEQHLREGCEYCGEQVQQAFWATATLAGLAEPVQAPKSLRKQVLQIAAPRSQERRWLFATSGLAAVALVLLGVVLWSGDRTASLRSEIGALSSQRDDFRGQVAVLKSEQAQLHRTVDTLSQNQNNLQGRSQALVEARNQLSSRARTLQNSVQSLTTERNGLRGQLQTTESERTQALSQAQGMQNTIATLTRERDDLRQQVQNLDYQRNQLENERGKLQSIVAVVGNAGTRALPFGGKNGVPRGHVFLTPAGEVLLVAQQLPRLATDRTFQFWVVPASGAPQSGGVFRSNTAGDVVFSSQGVRVGAGSAAVAVSVEPAGGSPAPTTKPFIVVPLKS
jgi:anti-sigma-K factor RskA